MKYDSAGTWQDCDGQSSQSTCSFSKGEWMECEYIVQF